jgi:hypothetical protein
MSTFNEESTVEQMVLDTLSGLASGGLVTNARGFYTGTTKGWRFMCIGSA